MPKKYQRIQLEEHISESLKPSRITIDPAIRRQSVCCLNITLATLSDLKSHVKQAHWAVKGTDYYQLHVLFDEMAGELDPHIDSIAERISILGGTVRGTNSDACLNTILSPFSSEISNGIDHLNRLADDYALVGNHFREHKTMLDELGDKGTADMYGGLALLADKRLWFLESHLQ